MDNVSLYLAVSDSQNSGCVQDDLDLRRLPTLTVYHAFKVLQKDATLSNFTDR